VTRDELLALPVSVDVATAGRALGIGRTVAFQLIRAGRFPVPVLHLGAQYRVPTAPLLALLGITPDMSEAGAPTPAIATTHEETSEVSRDAERPTRLRAVHGY